MRLSHTPQNILKNWFKEIWEAHLRDFIEQQNAKSLIDPHEISMFFDAFFTYCISIWVTLPEKISHKLIYHVYGVSNFRALMDTLLPKADTTENVRYSVESIFRKAA